MTLAPDRIRPRARQLIWLAVALTGFGTAQAGQPYALGISDKLNIKVVQWKAAESEFAEWSALSGEYVVGADGNPKAVQVIVGASDGARTVITGGDLKPGMKVITGQLAAGQQAPAEDQNGDQGAKGDRNRGTGRKSGT